MQPNVTTTRNAPQIAKRLNGKKRRNGKTAPNRSKRLSNDPRSIGSLLCWPSSGRERTAEEERVFEDVVRIEFTVYLAMGYMAHAGKELSRAAKSVPGNAFPGQWGTTFNELPNAILYATDTGNLLIAAKRDLGDGNWRSLLRRLSLSKEQAEIFMGIATEAAAGPEVVVRRYKTKQAGEAARMHFLETHNLPAGVFSKPTW